jgi:hypothetical protein
MNDVRIIFTWCRGVLKGQVARVRRAWPMILRVAYLEKPVRSLVLSPSSHIVLITAQNWRDSSNKVRPNQRTTNASIRTTHSARGDAFLLRNIICATTSYLCSCLECAMPLVICRTLRTVGRYDDAQTSDNCMHDVGCSNPVLTDTHVGKRRHMIAGHAAVRQQAFHGPLHVFAVVSIRAA